MELEENEFFRLPAAGRTGAGRKTRWPRGSGVAMMKRTVNMTVAISAASLPDFNVEICRVLIKPQ